MAVIWPCVPLPVWQQTLTSCQGHSDKLSALYKYKIYTKETGRFALKGLPFTTADTSDFVKSSHVVRNCIRRQPPSLTMSLNSNVMSAPHLSGLRPTPRRRPANQSLTSF